MQQHGLLHVPARDFCIRADNRVLKNGRAFSSDLRAGTYKGSGANKSSAGIQYGAATNPIYLHELVQIGLSPIYDRGTFSFQDMKSRFEVVIHLRS
jgi:hypothetical protein